MSVTIRLLLVIHKMCVTYITIKIYITTQLYAIIYKLINLYKLIYTKNDDLCLYHYNVH